MQSPHRRDHDQSEASRAAQMRRVAFVLAGTIILWMGAQWLGGAMGWQTRFVFLFDFAALAAFIRALVVTYQIWRGRQT